MTTVPFMSTEASDSRIASTARWSAASLFPRPCRGAAASAPASVTRNSSSARLRLIFGSSITESRVKESAQAAAADRQLVGLHPELLFAGEPAVPSAVDVDARPFQDRGHADLLLAQDGVEPVDQDLVLVELD